MHAVLILKDDFMTTLNQKKLAGAVLCALLALSSAAGVAANQAGDEPNTAGQSQLEKSAQEAARKHANRTKQANNGKQAEKAASKPAEENGVDEDTIKGPATIPLGAEGSLKLPAGMLFIKKEAANALMVEHGNSSNPNRYGLILPEVKEGEDVTWWVDLDYVDSGYIKDDDAKEWDTEAMLNELKAGNEEQNKVRKSKGIAETETRGWIEKPQYDAATHRLIWSIDVYEKGGKDENPAVNYNTFQLGRKGYISLTLVTDLKEIDKMKPVARELLSNIEFNQGLRYADFNATTDKVAEYGLAALIGGVAAKKLGLLAVIGAFFVKFGKIIALAAVGLGAGLKGRFGRKKDK